LWVFTNDGVGNTDACPGPLVQVIKIGGAALGDPSWLTRFAQQATGNSHRVIVHGGGPEVSALSQQLGIAVEWNGGRRVTSEAAMDVTEMVLTGRINKRIVRALCAAGLDAIGISGEDAGLIRARVGHGGALGRVGEVTEVRAEIIRAMITLGVTPVIAPVSLGEDGGALNVNADEAALAVAKALCAKEMLFLTDVAAVRDESGNRAELSTAEAKQLIDRQIATGGMAIKLGAAIAAVEAGIARVRVGALEMMNDEQAGTEIRREEVAAWR
jgi:acetylglutamate kinase